MSVPPLKTNYKKNVNEHSKVIIYVYSDRNDQRLYVDQRSYMYVHVVCTTATFRFIFRHHQNFDSFED